MLQACFILLTLLLAIALYLMAVRVSLRAIKDPQKQKRFIQRTAIVLIGWLVYISAASVTGIFAITVFPPRIPLLLVLPAFLFFVYFFTAPRFRNFITLVPPAWPVYFQSFRVMVELLIWGLYMKGIFPQSATFEGHNFDILIGLTAPFVAYYTFTKARLGKIIFKLWNIAGLSTLVIIVSIIMRHAYLPSMQNNPENVLTKGFGTFPYTFLAGLFMPLAVFMHIFSLIKIRKTV